MSIDMSQFYQVFFDETEEHLAEMETLLLGLDIDNPSMEDLNAIFRAAHSIKGGSGTFGFTDITSITHVLESLLDKLRKGETTLKTEMVDAFLQAGDVIKAQLAAHKGEGEADEGEAVRVSALIESLMSESASPPENQGLSPEASTEIEHLLENEPRILQISFTLENPETKLDNLFEDMAQLGQLEFLEKGENLKYVINLTTYAPESEIRDMLDFFVPADKISIGTPATEEESYGFFEPEEKAAEEEGYGFFEPVEKIQEKRDDTQGYGFFEPEEKLQEKIEENQGYGFFQPVAPPQEEPVKKMAATPAKSAEAQKTKPAQPSDATSIRVNVDKVDQLINLVGELVITEAMLSQTAAELDPIVFEKLHNGLAQLERNTRDLQESIMSIRMMPIAFVFSRFPRVVREIAGKLSKQVELKTEGEGTELDKGLIEKIADPLTHLVRNSLDHGIESPERRIAAGKDPKGTITLKAFHQGGSITIEVVDDGAGLNRQKILNKAIERGLPVNESATDQEVWGLIFEAGFSTADVVTDVSGRGVGMDVVKRNIHEMGGRVDIDSVEGAGTRISIKLPLTLAILDGMSIGVGDQTLIIPLNYIVETLQPRKEDIKSVSGEKTLLHLRGEYLPLALLHEIFNIPSKVQDIEHGIAVILEQEGKKFALFVDELIGQHQVVIKSLESNYRKVPGISGATIMGDGKVALILDVGALLAEAKG